MKTTLQNFSGLFQVESHKPSTRFLWILTTLLCLAILTFGIWTIFVDLFDFRQNIEKKHFEIVLKVIFILVLPTWGLIFGSIKILQKPGVYLRGFRVTNKGIEIGTLALNQDSDGCQNILEKIKFDNIVVGDWIQKKNINSDELDFIIVLRIEGEATKLVFFEKLVVLSAAKILYQLIGKNSTQIIWNDLVALSNGSFLLLEDTNGVSSNQLFNFLEILDDLVSSYRAFHSSSCTLNIVKSPTNLGNVLATGMLGCTIVTERIIHQKDKKKFEDFSDTTFARSLRKFLHDRGWSYSTKDKPIA